MDLGTRLIILNQTDYICYYVISTLYNGKHCFFHFPYPIPHTDQIPLGVSIAATIRVGNELGAGRPRTAKRAAYVTVGIGGMYVLYSWKLWQGCRQICMRI